MTSTFVVSGLGTTTVVDTGDRIDRETFRMAWSRCIKDPVASSDGATQPQSPIGPLSSMTTLTQTITGELIKQRAGELLMLHAGAVCNSKTGATVAYAARGGTGKTTLTHRLGTNFGYVTDETVGVEPNTWRVVPYEKPLSILESESDLEKTENSPDDLGLLRAHPKPHLAALLILRRSPSTTSPIWTHLNLFEGITTLIPETSSLRKLNKPLQLLDSLYQAVGGFWLVEYSDTEQIMDRVASFVEAS